MKTYYAAFGHWYGHDALLKICDTIEEAKAAIYEAAAKNKKAKMSMNPLMIHIISLLRLFKGGTLL